MREWFDSLEASERALLVAALVAVTVIALYLTAWRPFDRHVQALDDRVTQQQELLAWMQGTYREVERLRGDTPGDSGTAERSVLGLINETATAQRLGGSLKRVEGTGNNAVRVWFEDAAFDDLVLWLGTLQLRYNIGVDSVVVDGQRLPGRINARVVLQGR